MFVQKGNLTSLTAVLSSLHADLLAGGFTPVLPASSLPLSVLDDAGVFVVESSDTINPVNEGQAYRIRMEVAKAKKGEGSFMTAVVAGVDHITNTGKVFTYPEVVTQGGFSTSSTQVMGALGTGMEPVDFSAGGSKQTGSGGLFVTRGNGEGTSSTPTAPSKAYTDAGAGVNYGYTLSVSDHGVVFYMWENATEGKPIYSMFCVQSPVNKDTGDALVDLKSPIFCVYSNNNSPMMKFIVNESDVSTPTKSVRAGEDSTDSAAIVNEEDQVAVKLDNKYLVTFPNRVNTERFAYSEELDLIAYSSAKVIGEDTVLPITVYGELTERKYRAMKANKENNNGMRLLVLQEGSGVTPTP